MLPPLDSNHPSSFPCSIPADHNVPALSLSAAAGVVLGAVLESLAPARCRAATRFEEECCRVSPESTIIRSAPAIAARFTAWVRRIQAIAAHGRDVKRSRGLGRRAAVQ